MHTVFTANIFEINSKIIITKLKSAYYLIYDFYQSETYIYKHTNSYYLLKTTRFNSTLCVIFINMYNSDKTLTLILKSSSVLTLPKQLMNCGTDIRIPYF